MLAVGNIAVRLVLETQSAEETSQLEDTGVLGEEAAQLPKAGSMAVLERLQPAEETLQLEDTGVLEEEAARLLKAGSMAVLAAA